jgi:NAD(P) transhydrogenase
MPAAEVHLTVDGSEATLTLTFDGKQVVDSNTVLDLKKLPKTMVVLGAGIIGCEYASMFAMAGTKVHLIDRRHEILASVDREIVSHLTERFQSLKMDIKLRVEATQLERLQSGVRVHLSDGTKLKADCVLVTLGRCGNIEGLGLQEVGVVVDERGIIKVDTHYRTSVPTIQPCPTTNQLKTSSYRNFKPHPSNPRSRWANAGANGSDGWARSR